MSGPGDLRALKAEAEASCTHRVRALAVADDEVDARQLLLEAGYHAGRTAAIEELIARKSRPGRE